MSARLNSLGFAVRRPNCLITLLGLGIALLQASCRAEQPTFTPNHASGIYDVGEPVGWNVTPLDAGPAPSGKFGYKIKKNNLDLIESGELDLASGKASIEVSINEPAMVFVEVEPQVESTDSTADKDSKASGDSHSKGGNTKRIVLGAAVAPTKLQPSAPRPADFDSFWEAKIQLLKLVPENVVLTPGDSGKPDVEYATIQMDHINGAHVYGQLAKPKREGKFPALVIFQWASPPYPLQKPWVTDRASEGWLALNIEPHDVLPDQPQAYYDALPKSIKNYQSIGNDDRDKSYFLQMYLADYRAVDYLASRPDWDGNTLVVMGTSMGGQQSLCVAGLHPKITHLIVNEPAGCDTNGPLHGRQSGYPNFPSNNPKVMETAPYFDAVNFASRINAQSLVAMGFVDTVAPPAGIWTAFNQIKGAKEAVPMIDSPHNNLATPAQQQPYTRRSAEWLAALVKGDKVPDGATSEAIGERKAVLASTASAVHIADRPAPRSDEISLLAHEQLLEKAKQGKIDVYFVGDSITRRWGTSDPQYKGFLKNWNDNFFGWNAGDFGWGADSTQNILWRLENGELDGVNPKIIVILAGTNNVGSQPGNEAEVLDVTRGIKAILNVCREKAPTATIILTGIFPRNDNMDVVPSINKINENLADFADGKKIRYLNVNDKLADEDGKLFDGMMDTHDKLHPTAKGYQVWADELKPIIAEVLGPPAATDTAPPPTGVPQKSAAPH